VNYINGVLGKEDNKHRDLEVDMQQMWDDDLEDPEVWDSSLDITSLQSDYDAGVSPQCVLRAIYERIEAYQEVQPSVWIHVRPFQEVMDAAAEILSRWPDPENRPSLWGIPFSVKDSIDVAGIPTTGSCPPLAFTPDISAPVYQRCVDAGALFVGKTNMEQLATGMTGCRSPFGTLHSTFSESHIVGGSSSGSAVTVSQGLVSFSLGSDTAGSIRIPALFNGIVGLKPTKGTVSARGVMPACLHQDCVSFLALSIGDAEKVLDVCQGFDKHDFFARLPPNVGKISQITDSNHRFRFGIPPASVLRVCSPHYGAEFARLVSIMAENGGELIEMDWAPFSAANKLLYEGTFVLERLTMFPEGWLESNKHLLHPVIRQVFENALARNSSAVDVFKDLQKQAKYKRAVEETLKHDEANVMTVMVVPTAPYHPTIQEVELDPIGVNVELGTFAHCANVLDLAAVALPCSTYEIDEMRKGSKIRLPFGVTILSHAGLDKQLLRLAARLEDILRDLDYSSD
jgi:allophanate hydrolase